jgi:hypothetical protein
MQLLPTNCRDVWEWVDDSKLMYDAEGNVYGLRIHTLEGEMRADINDWVIRGVRGEFYPCKPDIFAATYEPEGNSARQEEEIR